MRIEYKTLLAGFITIAIFDAVFSIASRQFDFNYMYLVSGSVAIYTLFGYIATMRTDFKTGILTATVVGLFDSTIGWQISIVLSANTGSFKIQPTIFTWVLTVTFVTALGAFCGWLGGKIAKHTKKG